MRVMHSALAVGEKASMDRMLDECYGQPWSLSALELGVADVKCEDHTVTESKQIFSLTESDDIVHPLLM